MTSETPAWVRDAVFYQVFPDRLARSGRVPAPGALEAWEAPPTEYGFKGGDLYGVVQHLDRLDRLGITALYLNPVFSSAANHRYHTDDYFHVDPLLGGDDALRELLDQAHARDMRVVLDGVFNHAGRGFWPFHHVLENGHQSPYRDWFYLHQGVRTGERSVTAYPRDDEFAAMDAMRVDGAARGATSQPVLGYQAWWDLPALPKLNLDDPQARAFVLDVAEHWIRFGIDGWRLDVAEEVAADFWREFHQRVRASNPEAYLVAEVWQPKPEWLRGDMFDAFMNYPLLEAMVGFAAQGRIDNSIVMPDEWQDGLSTLDAASFWSRLVELEALHGPGVDSVQLNLLGSHDTPRLLTLCGGDLASVRLAMLLQMTLPGAPCIYQGDEIGMEGAMDPDCRRAFPIDPNTWMREPYAWVADLVALRHSSRALRDGSISLLDADDRALAYLRRFEEDTFAIIVNTSDDPLSWEIPLPLDMAVAALVLLDASQLSSESATAAVEGSRLSVVMAARSGVVVRLTPGDLFAGRA